MNAKHPGGRPRKYGQEKTRTISVVLPESHIARLDAMSEAQKLSRSEVVANLLSTLATLNRFG